MLEQVQHFVDTFKEGKADAALAASVFHFGEIAIFRFKKRTKTQQYRSTTYCYHARNY